jgi:hypothetical protein
MKHKTLIIALALLTGALFSSAPKAGLPCNSEITKCTKQGIKKHEVKAEHDFMPGNLIYHFL